MCGLLIVWDQVARYVVSLLQRLLMRLIRSGKTTTQFATTCNLQHIRRNFQMWCFPEWHNDKFECLFREIKTARGHVMPPPLHGSCRPCWHSVPYVLWNLWSRSLCGSTVLTSIRIFCRVLLPCPWYSFAQNSAGSYVDGSEYLLQTVSKSVLYSCKVNKQEPLLSQKGRSMLCVCQ